MRRTRWVLVLVLVSVAGIRAQLPQPSIGRDLTWAFPVINGAALTEEPGPRRVPGSAKTYTPAQIDDLTNPPDWFPDGHAPAPAIIQKGHGAALACGSCHLMSGHGHPESAGVAGFTAEYLIRQMADFKSGARKDSARMNAIAKEVSDEESRQAAEWMAALRPTVWTNVIEADTVPKTFVGQGRMRFVEPGDGKEPIGNRIVTVPQDQDRARSRDPYSGFTAYVPVGAIARGKALTETGGAGKAVACSTCHGDSLKGLGNVPGLAGLHPISVGRQLYLFKDGRRNGVDAQLMKKTVAQLTDEDIVALAAYLGSLAP